MSGRWKIAVLIVVCWLVGTPVLFGQLRGGACCGVPHVAGESQEPGDGTRPVLQPDDIARLPLPDVRITSVTHRAKLTVVGIGPEAQSMDAPHLEVHGLIGGTIGFELLLPDCWNRRIVMGGGGGLVGSFIYAGKDAVTRGYAVVGTDTGHQAPTGFTADWALYDLEAQINFGYLAVHRTIEVAKAIVTACYGQHAEFSYFTGCSTGGRQALMEAQRYPADFDGIVCACPVTGMTGEMVTLVHYAQKFFPQPGPPADPPLSQDELQRLHQEVINQCDEQDGVKDGLLDDPRRCHLDWSKLAWLSPRQQELVRAAYDGPQSNGVSIHPGLPLGTEGDWYGWFGGRLPQLPADLQGPSMSFILGTEFCKYFVFGDAHWDYSTYDLANWPRDSRLVASFVDATDTDLAGFRAAGGKLILWHGWCDGLATPLTSIQYYEDVERRDPHVRDFFRLFMLPGVRHCGQGAGPDHVDWLATIVQWVEHGRAPDRIVAAKLGEDGTATWTRPVYPYPQRVVYRGTGSVQDEASFISDRETATVGTCEMSKRTYVYKRVGDCPIKADVYRLPGDEPRPALVWIHGGALIMGDRGLIELAVFRDYLRRYLEAGFVVISIDYRLAPETKLPQIIEDLQDAFRWVRETGPEAFQIDPQRVAVTGGSAGGYLTLMAGCCVEPRPQCLVSFYGYGDIVGDWYAKPDAFYLKEPAVSQEEAYASVGKVPLSGCAFSTEEGVKRGRFYLYCRQTGRWCHEVAGLDPIKDLETLVPFCPVRNVTKEYPPTMLLHGDQDTDVPHAQSILMAKELARHGVAPELRILSGQGHAFELVLKDNEWKKNEDPQVTAAMEAVLLFLKKHVEK